MPLYEYDCESCGQRSELLVRRKGQRVACPHCGSRKLTRLLSTFAAPKGARPDACADACAAGLDRCKTGCPMS